MKNFRTYAFAALLTGALAFPVASANAETSATSVDAQTTTTSGAITSRTFQSLDMDRSGSLSEAEFSKYSAAGTDFDAADVNGDGRLTLSEAQSVPSSPVDTPDTMAE